MNYLKASSDAFCLSILQEEIKLGGILESLIDILQKNIKYIALNSFQEYCMKIMHSLREEFNVTELSFNVNSITPIPGKQLRINFHFYYMLENHENPADAFVEFLTIAFDVPNNGEHVLHFEEDDIKDIQNSVHEAVILTYGDKPTYILSAFSKLLGAYLYLDIVSCRFTNGAIYNFAY